MKIKDIIEKIPEERRKELENIVDACMKSICHTEVEWKEFEVYDSSTDLMSKILQNLAIEFLLPIVEEAKKKPERTIIILCNASKKDDDEVWIINKSASKIYATITLSPQTAKMLSKKTEEKPLEDKIKK